jgi:hypothetical protein
MPSRRWAGLFRPVAAAALLVRLFSGIGLPLPAAAGLQRSGLETGTAADPLYPHGHHPEIGFATRQKFLDHYEKHGREFGAPSQTGYLRLAQDLRDRRAGIGILEFVRDDRVITRFDRKSGAFLAFERDLIIRTFFKPNDGEAYFKRQQRRIPRQP